MTRGQSSRSPVPHYSATSRRRAAAYDAVRFETVHAALLDLLPPPGARVLDLGAGSGRDALALAARGYNVTAVEPTRAFREHGQGQDPSGAVTWIDDRLPTLSRLLRDDPRFTFILCSAVLMHLPPQDLRDAFRTMAGLLEPHGRLAISVRDMTRADPPGLIINHSNATLTAAGEWTGLTPIRATTSGDVLGREGIHWRSLVFEAAPAPPHPGLGQTKIS